MANLVTQIVIRARDEASSVFGSLQAKTAAVATAIAGLFGIKLFSDAVSSAKAFEAAISAVQAASGASGEQLSALRIAAEEAGATTKYTSVEAAGALENLSRAGLSATDAIKTLPAVLNLATAGGVGLGEASDYIAKAVAGMGLSFAEAGRVADVLAMGANASNTSVTGLAQALSYAAPLASSLGLSVEQTVAIIGKFADAGIDASRAGTALNSVLAQFSNPSSKFREELSAAGITTSDFDQALRQLAAAGPAGQRAINAVGQEAGPALRALLNQGIDSLDALKGKLDDSAGSAASFAKVVGDNMEGAAKGFSSAWDALLVKVGTPVLGTLKNQINAVSERLRAFVTDGTATAFGDAIKAAFESAGRWVQEFVSKVDFKQLAADMQAFAARTGELFDALGTKSGEVARNATIAFGVLSASLNTILAAVYKVGEAFAGVGSNIVSVAAWIAEAFSKITFGAMSESFRAAADEIRIAAGGLWATSEAFAQQSSAAFDRATADALRVREAWDDVGTSAAAASTQAATALEAVGAQVGLTADQVAALGEGAVVMGGKVVESATASAGALNNLGMAAKASGAEQKKSAQALKVDVEALYEEYERLFEAGDIQRANAKFAELQRMLRETSHQATATADELELAFQNLGVTSQAELDRLAGSALKSFKLIRDSGTATPRELQAAFVAYAQKAIEANGGVASESLKAEAALYKVRMEADEA
ncbi:MAG: phage tail tape measure protein, partial [Thauera sp.]|nr:phage tail tape measure protein [Thauera sp.]